VLEKATKEVVGRKTKSLLEGGKHRNLFSIGCWDVLPFGRPSLKYHEIWEEMILD
jgi:hypothetical protein